MLSIRDIDIPTAIDTSRHDITREFFVPLLSHSIRYDRGVGFFSSGWLKINALGMAVFAANQGRARWITSPILSPEDWRAMLEGSRARRSELLRQSLERNIADLAASLEAHTLSALAWMIADGILDFRLAVPANELTGEFHAKFGIFYDDAGNRLSFEGSYNDSIQRNRKYDEF